jgi:hypothetical protein
MSVLWPLSGEKRKWLGHRQTDEIDPEQKSEIKIVRISDTCTSLESGVRSSNLFGRATTPFKPLVHWVDTAYVSW